MTVTTQPTVTGNTIVRLRGNCTGQKFTLEFKTREDALALLKALRKRVR